MEYNIYLDVFFLLNFVINGLVLQSAGWILHRKIPIKRLLMGAGIGAMLNVLTLFLGLDKPGLVFLIAGIMSVFSFGKREGKDLILGSILLLLPAFCMEGAMRFTGSLYSILLVPFASFLIGRERKKREPEMMVTLHFHGRQITLPGFYDSGNGLTEPMTGRMVHVACYDDVKIILPKAYREMAEQYFQTGLLEDTKVTKLQMYEFTFLSYHSIGNETGQLLGIRMDRAVFENAVGQKTEEKAVIGLADQKLYVRGQSRIIVNGRLEL